MFNAQQEAATASQTVNQVAKTIQSKDVLQMQSNASVSTQHDSKHANQESPLLDAQSLELCRRVLPVYVKSDPWQAKWEVDTTRDLLHEICLEIFATSTSASRRFELRKRLKELTQRHAVWSFEGHVQTYGTGLVGSIGELLVPDSAQGHFLRYREQRVRIVQDGSGRYGRCFSIVAVF